MQALSVDQLLVQCPTAQQVAAIHANLRLSFESDPAAGNLVCSAAKGSADLTLLQRRVYQTLQAMQRLQFSKPLPWTDKSLYEWFVGTIKAIRFRSDIQNSFCCDPKDTINVRVASNTYLVVTDRWIDPGSGGGLMDSVVLYVHEARHNQGYGHTCGTNDKTLAEMGAWGVQYYLDAWLADYSDPSFISDPYYRQSAKSHAEDIRKTRFCDEPK